MVEGLRLYVPQGSSPTLQLRMAHLNRDAAKFQLCELDERSEQVEALDYADHGNIHTRLLRCPDAPQVRSRFASAIGKVLAQAPEAEAVVLSPTEIAFRLHGLEFARVRASVSTSAGVAAPRTTCSLSSLIAFPYACAARSSCPCSCAAAARLR